MTFDNEDELDKIAAHYPTAQCVLRILADDSASVCRLGLKFGAPLQRVRALLTHARARGLAVVGVSYHVGSGNGDATSFAGAIGDARAAFDIGRELGYEMTLLDLGGGYPGSALGEGHASSSGSSSALERRGAEEGGATLLGSSSTTGGAYALHPTFGVIAGHMRRALDAHFPLGCGVDIIGEPGRFIVKSSSTLAVCIVGKRRTEDEEEEAQAQAQRPGAERLNYYVNDGLYGSFNCNVYDHADPQPLCALRLAPSGSHIAQEIDLTPAALARLAASDAQAAAAAASAATAEGDAALGLRYSRSFAVAAAAGTQLAEEAQQQQRLVLGGRGGGGAAVTAAAAAAAVLQSMSSATQLHASDLYGHSGTQHTLKMGGRREMHGSAATPAPVGAADAAAAASGAAAAAAASTSPSLFPTTLWGPTCDSFDKISDSIKMPELAPGDWIVYENMGAYTIAGSCKCVFRTPFST